MSQKNRHSDRVRDFREAFSEQATQREHYKNFVASKNYDKRLASAEKIGKMGSSESLADSGAMFLELAFTSPEDDDASLILFERAIQNLEASEAREERVRSSQVAKAGMYLACIGIYQHLLLFREAPSVEALEASYQDQLELAMDLDEDQRYFAKQPKTRYTKEAFSDLKGALAESSVLLLLQRFTLSKLGDTSWLPLPSFFSHDSSPTSGQTTNSWDVSVYTNIPHDITDPTYKIQVKAHKNHGVQGKQYGNDITEVAVGDDLSIRYGNGRTIGQIPSYLIARECWHEQYPDESTMDIFPTERLDKRTERLLDILG